MILVAIMLILVVGVALFQVTQGVFSALIMMMLTIISALVAFGYYLPMAEYLLYGRQPAHAQGASLIALFVITMIALRIAADKFIAGNVVMNVWANRIGAGAAGLVTGVILVGVLGAGIQLLPVGENFFGFVSHEDTLEPKHTLLATDITLNVIGALSDGAMSGEDSWNEDNRDFAREAFCARNTAGANGRRDAEPDTMRVMGIQQIDDPDGGASAKRTYVVRVAVSSKTRNADDNCWRLPATQFRLVTTDGKSVYPSRYKAYGGVPEGANKEVYLREVDAEKGTGKDDKPRLRVGKLVVVRMWSNGPEELVVNWHFVLDKQYKQKDIDYITFRRTVRVDIPKSMIRIDRPLPELNDDGAPIKPKPKTPTTTTGPTTNKSAPTAGSPRGVF